MDGLHEHPSKLDREHDQKREKRSRIQRIAEFENGSRCMYAGGLEEPTDSLLD